MLRRTRGPGSIRFSVIVPTFHRNQRLRDCLKGLSRLDFPRADFEVIVVDDGSLEPPYDEVRGFEPFLQIRLIALATNWGPATARNEGAAHARGAYLAFIDDDCVPDPDWLAAIDERLRQFPGALVGGGLRNRARENVCAEASHELVQFLYRYYNTDPDNARWFTSANIACPRDQFLSLGGFGTGFPLAAAEDRDLCDRWREAGNLLITAPRAMVDHVRPASIGEFWQQHRRYGRGAHHLHRARARRGAALPNLEPLRFYFALILSPFTSQRGWRAAVLSGLLILSQIGYAAGYYPERARSPLPAGERPSWWRGLWTRLAGRGRRAESAEARPDAVHTPTASTGRGISA
jgi:GT2 family glycosyltransferase